MRTPLVSVLATVACIALPARHSHADVVYRNIADIELLSNPGVVIDIDQDGQAELQFNVINNCVLDDTSETCYRRWEVVPALSAAVISEGTYTTALNPGDAIGSGSNYGLIQGGPSVITEGTWIFSGGSWSHLATGSWGDENTSLFMGVRFTASDGVHYAWVRILNDSPSGNLVVTDLAYQSVPGIPITAGAGLCPADFNGDGFLDIFDFNDFVTCFEGDACPPGTSADFNGDGFPDIFDFNDFVTAFETGC